MKPRSVAEALAATRLTCGAFALLACAAARPSGSNAAQRAPAASASAAASGPASASAPVPGGWGQAARQAPYDMPTALELYPKLDYLTGLLGDVPGSELLLQIEKENSAPVDELPAACRQLPQQLIRESLWMRCIASPGGGVWLVQARASQTDEEQRGSYRVGFLRNSRIAWGPERPYHVLFNGYSVATPPLRAIFLDSNRDGTHEVALLGYDGVNASDVGERTLNLYRIDRKGPAPLRFTEDHAAFALEDCNGDGRPELYYDPHRRFGSEASLSFGFYNRRSSTAWSLLAELGPEGVVPDTALARAYASSLCSDVGPEPLSDRRPGEWPHVLHCQRLTNTEPSVLQRQIEAGCARANEEVARFCSYNRKRLLEMTTTKLPFQLAGAKEPGAPQCLLPPVDQ